MRKSVDLMLEYLLLFTYLPWALPLLSWMIVATLLQTTTWSFLFVNVIIFAFRSVIQSHLIRFTIDNHIVAEVVEIAFEVIQISVTFGSYIRPTIDPEWINWSSFLLPLPALNNMMTIAVIAYNKGQNIELLQRNVVVNGNDLTTVMHVSLLSLGIKFIIMVFLLPFKIYNDPKDPARPWYLCTSKFWRKLKYAGEGADESVQRFNETLETRVDANELLVSQPGLEKI